MESIHMRSIHMRSIHMRSMHMRSIHMRSIHEDKQLGMYQLRERSDKVLTTSTRVCLERQTTSDGF